ncbi:MAG: Mov34/MPN/PAD-1 family protein [Methylomonas sp.]
MIEENVLNLVESYRQNSPKKPESGGILLGYRRESHLHVIDATSPQPFDKRSRFNFFRKDRKHQDFAIKKWLSSRETIDYVGEWHTHPENSPNPSALDVSEWRKIIEVRQNSMIFLIVGINREIWLGIGAGESILSASIDMINSRCRPSGSEATINR